MWTGTADFLPPEVARAHEKMFEEGKSDIWARPRAEIADLFEGLELVEPGVVPNTHWRPEPGDPEIDLRLVAGYTATGRKP